MKNFNYRVVLSAIVMVSILAGFSQVSAGPVRFDQVVQVVNAKPGKATTGTFSRLAVAGDYSSILINDDDDKKKKQDGRVITETKTEIVEDEACDWTGPDVAGGFPKWWLLGLAAIPVAFILIKRKKDTPTPTQTVPNLPRPRPRPRRRP
ncbi:MAG: hypothetical protein IPK98_07395 [Chloracidobacterium sp.]|nr:hypothetical protein [Chloracidobacterium sp.]